MAASADDDDIATLLAGGLGDRLSCLAHRRARRLESRRHPIGLELIAALGDIEAHAAYGDPAEELTLYSASLDLLVLGSRGYGPLGRLVHGSTAHQLANTARCPLLVLARNAQTTSPAGSADDRATAAPAA